MARHFLQLYLLIVVALAIVNWGQERLWQTYARPEIAADHPSQAAALLLVEQQLRGVPDAERRQFVARLATSAGIDLELFGEHDIAGDETLRRLAHGELAMLSGADGRTWLLRRLADDGRVLAFRYVPPEVQRGPLDWLLALTFYAAIALVIMLWLWPLTRDLRRLERATSSFGNRNWTFDIDIKERSQVFSLAQSFRRMAARIDALIGSHRDMSNAISHEIKTPLARMRFEIEMARTATRPDQLATHLDSITTDITELNSFVTAALDYAILERAEVALNIAEHDFTLIVPAVTDSVRRSARPDLDLRCDISDGATRVRCDAHLIETVLRNLLYNALRYARTRILVRFLVQPDGCYVLSVDDDGPGIPADDRQRVFGSFVQLEPPSDTKVGYGLGLAIVKRVSEWHGGEASVTQSSLGGACFLVRWPATAASRDC